MIIFINIIIYKYKNSNIVKIKSIAQNLIDVVVKVVILSDLNKTIAFALYWVVTKMAVVNIIKLIAKTHLRVIKLHRRQPKTYQSIKCFE